MLVLDNEAAYIRRDLSARLLSLYFEDRLLQEVDALAIHMYPKEKHSVRCCIYKDRAMIRYRLMALLGISIEQSDDETRLLSSYVEEALAREKVEEPVLTFLDMACSACDSGRYHVTELCQGCVARPCINACPKDCITMVGGRSVIDSDKCIKCGKCESVCPYNTIVYLPVPCEEKCPVDAISKNFDTGREEIDYDKCIYCGKCTRTCPFGAVMERSQILDVAKHLRDSGKKVVAMVAPSIVGQFPGTVEQLNGALEELGFDSVYEVANGADQTAKAEAAELKEKIEEGQDILGTSCCPAYTEAVKKHVPDFQEKVSHTPTPMAFTAIDARNDDKDAVTVFIGPCVAKRYEGIHNDNVDYVLTYEELGSFFIAKGIGVESCKDRSFETDESSAQARRFAVSSGVAGAVISYSEGIAVKPMVIDGLDKKGLRQLKRVAKSGAKDVNLLEVMSCEGGCLYGPGVTCNPKISKRKLDEYSS